MTQSSTIQEFRGRGAAPGYAIGRVYVFETEEQVIPRRRILPDEVDLEIERFEQAVTLSISQLDDLVQRMQLTKSKGLLIVEVHRLILQDELLVERTRQHIRERQINAEAALRRTLRELTEAFSQLEDSYLKQRQADLRFVGQQLMGNLLGNATSIAGRQIPPGSIIVAHDLSPSDTLDLSAEKISGFVTEVGSTFSHTAIMARAMEIPAVVGVGKELGSCDDGDDIVLDGQSGRVFLKPDPNTIAQFHEKQRQYQVQEAKLLGNWDRPAVTTDGIRVRLEGNIGYLAEVESLLSHGGEGIGLVRTEFLFLSSTGAPNEETQYANYKRIVEAISPGQTTFRTLDLGGDKLSGVFGFRSPATNPALGIRGIRFSLKEPAPFRQQLRAIFRASAHGPVRILIPFVTSLSDFRAAQTIIDDVRSELEREGQPFDRSVPVGTMIEVPAAALIAETLAREAAFFSLGTNDLVQYTLAVDRTDENLAALYTSLHPAVLRLIARTTRAAQEAHIDISICGEMAGNSFNTPALLGCGLQCLSMNPISIPPVKEVIGRCEVGDCKRLVDELLALPTVAEVEARLQEFHNELHREEKTGLAG